MKSIRNQLTVSILIGLFIVYFLSSLLIYQAARSALIKEMDNNLVVKLSAMASSIKVFPQKVGYDFAERFLKEFSRTNVTEFYQICYSDGTVIDKSENLGNFLLPFHYKTTPKTWRIELPDGRPGRAASVSFKPKIGKEKKPPEPTIFADEIIEKKEPPPKEPKGTPREVKLPAGVSITNEMVLTVAEDASRIEDSLGILRTILTGTGALTLTVCIGLVRFLLNKYLAPINTLSEQASTIDASSLKSRFTFDDPPVEIAPIILRLNDLLDRLERSFERERTFSANIAHELRTPIAELRTLCEVELKYSDNAENNIAREAHDIAIHMETLVNRLLSVARSENQAQSLKKDKINLARCLKDSLLKYDPKLKEKSIELKTVIPDDCWIETDASLLNSIICNLLDNAFEYTPAGGKVEVQLSEICNDFQLTIANTVVELNESDLGNMFQRFWRKDPSRTGNIHSGLGLSIVKVYASILNLEVVPSLEKNASTSTFVMTIKKLKPQTASV